MWSDDGEAKEHRMDARKMTKLPDACGTTKEQNANEKKRTEISRQKYVEGKTTQSNTDSPL